MIFFVLKLNIISYLLTKSMEILINFEFKKDSEQKWLQHKKRKLCFRVTFSGIPKIEYKCWEVIKWEKYKNEDAKIIFCDISNM